MAYATVVVGTDGSECGLAAVDRAAELAASDAALLIVVCVADSVPAPAPATLSSAEFGEPRADQQVPDLDAAVTALDTATVHAEQAGAPGVTTVLVEGDPAQGLLGVATQPRRRLHRPRQPRDQQPVRTPARLRAGRRRLPVTVRRPHRACDGRRRAVTRLGGQVAPAGTAAERRSDRLLTQ